MNKNELLQEIKLRRFIRQAIKLRQRKLNESKKIDLAEEQKLRTKRLELSHQKKQKRKGKK